MRIPADATVTVDVWALPKNWSMARTHDWQARRNRTHLNERAGQAMTAPMTTFKMDAGFADADIRAVGDDVVCPFESCYGGVDAP